MASESLRVTDDELQQLSDLYDKTTTGCRNSQGECWLEGFSLDELNTPKIANCEFPGNWINPPLYNEIASFKNAADRNFSRAVHSAFPALLKELRRHISQELECQNLPGSITTESGTTPV